MVAALSREWVRWRSHWGVETVTSTGCVARRWLELATGILENPGAEFTDKSVGRELASNFDSDICVYSQANFSLHRRRRWLLPGDFPGNGDRSVWPRGDPARCYPPLLFYREAGVADV